MLGLRRRRAADTSIGPVVLRPACKVRYPWGVVAFVAVSLVAVGVLLHKRVGGEHGQLILDDLAQFTAAAGATVAAIVAAVRSSARIRRCWTAIAIGTGGWALGQAVWCYYELLIGRETPFPSVADAGYLVFPIGAAVGMWVFPSLDAPGARRRWLLDAGTVVTALIAVSWSTTLGAIARAGGSSPFAFAVSLAYPIGDILVLTLAMTGLARKSRYRRQLLLAGLAIGVMAVADSSFAYLVAEGSYHTGGPTDLGWLTAFGLLVVAGADAAHHARGSITVAVDDDDEIAPATTLPPAANMLPYVPLTVAAAIVAMRRIQGHEVGTVVLVTVSAAFIMVLVRQYLTMRENRTLLEALATREAQLHRQAFHDQLTGLPNRALFLSRVEHALELHRRDLRRVSVLFCDLDDFKTVNDRYGHGAGDELLTQVAEVLRATVRPGDTLARLGGDEFAILLEDGGDASVLAARIVDNLRSPFDLTDAVITVGSSVGITVLRAGHPTPSTDTLLTQADFAMYSAKYAGKGRIASYQPGMAGPNADHLELRHPLATAVSTGNIRAVFQPIVRLDTGQTIGVEALARWTHNGAEIPPASFIPVAARSGQLNGLTTHMLEESARNLSRWSALPGYEQLCVGVNIPPDLMTDRDFPARVAAVIDRYRLQPAQLVLEITEEALVDDPHAAQEVARRLCELGARLCLDDFGKGYSSLVRLQQMPLHSLKIDRDFIAEIHTNLSARRLAAAVLSFGHDMALEVVAEGVETEEQAGILRGMGCRVAQGYLFGRPVAGDVIDTHLVESVGAPSGQANPPDEQREPRTLRTA